MTGKGRVGNSKEVQPGTALSGELTYQKYISIRWVIPKCAAGCTTNWRNKKWESIESWAGLLTRGKHY